MLSFLQQEVERRGWMTAERFVDFVAISPSTPGPIAINMATFTRYQLGGLPGAFVATLAVSRPGIPLMMLLALCFFHFHERPRVQAPSAACARRWSGWPPPRGRSGAFRWSVRRPWASRWCAQS